jgi:hypothetical protein
MLLTSASQSSGSTVLRVGGAAGILIQAERAVVDCLVRHCNALLAHTLLICPVAAKHARRLRRHARRRLLLLLLPPPALTLPAVVTAVCLACALSPRCTARAGSALARCTTTFGQRAGSLLLVGLLLLLLLVLIVGVDAELVVKESHCGLCWVK